MKREIRLSTKVLSLWCALALFMTGSATMRASFDGQSPAVGAISGVVMDKAGRPLADAWVEAHIDTNNDNLWEYNGDGVHADANGVYLLRDLAPGIYRVRFFQDGYYMQCYDHATSIESATDILVTAGMTTPNINAELIHMGSIRGRVTDRRDDPLPRVVVEAFHDPEGDGTWQGALHHFAITDQEGHYAIEWLERGTYRVHFDSSSPYVDDEYYNNAVTVEEATDIFVDTSAMIDGIDVQLGGAAGRMTGRVTDEADQPLAGVSVTIYNDLDHDGVWQSEQYADTGADGTYVVAGLPDGAYRLYFRDEVMQYKLCPYLRHATQYYQGATTLEMATSVIIERERTATQIDARLAPASRIQGQLTDIADNPIGGVAVMAFGETAQNGCYSIRSDAQGRFDLGVNPDTYRLLYFTGALFVPYVSYTWEYYDNAASAEAATPIVMASRASATFDAQLAPPGTIRGQVTNRAGQGISQIRVTAYRDLTGNGLWRAVSSTVTDAAGYYGIPSVGGFADDYYDLPYRVGFTDLRTPPAYHPVFFTDAGYPETAIEIRVGEYMEVYGYDALLAPYGTVNFAPLARADHLPVLQTSPDGPWRSFGSVLANDQDTEAAPLRAELVQAPEQGTFTLHEDGVFTFAANGESWSSASFTYRANDGVNVSDVVSTTFFLTTDQRFLPIIRRGE
ncbi:MAG TPA: carboxypeptidase regulatory-like domain-containing protein [Caldilineaceae bacterium]|nr:carboxypeptidase regulatory-like domain-containing protein [Caldilineaceae bacterium]